MVVNVYRAVARLSGAALAIAALTTVAGAAPAGAVVSWKFTEDAVSLGMEGVSPHVERVGTTDRVWRAGTAAGTAVSVCTDAGACTAETLSTGGGGPVSDFTMAQAPSGMRAYFVLVSPSAGTKAVYSAACATAECLAIGAATPASSGMQVSTNAKAWGVPDAVRLPDGRIRIYIVESPVDGACPEKVASYISSDGISFTKESGWRLEGGYVDTEILRAKDGEWLMIMANGPGCGGLQRLFVSTSNDGLTWATPVALTSSDAGRLDPTGYETSAGSNVFRIYYASCSSNPCPNNTYAVKRGTLSIAPTAGEVGVTSKGGKTTITCVKGKITRKVSGTAPKCPKGYTKK
jgi:hypothetical protein